VKNGDRIYESACGIGLNLVMTLEVLKQDHGITDLEVHGNDYLQSSVDLAEKVLDRLAPAFGGRKGILCQADSTNLGHIPNATFDLVYTGYLAPLYDPLQFRKDYDKNLELLKELCETADRNWKSLKLLDIATQRQNDWHDMWVREMIRIAKPGVPIIFEQLRDPFCKGQFKSMHVHGQSRDWWRKAIDEYGWDVDPASLDFEDETIFGHRYHLFMRKNAEEAR